MAREETTFLTESWAVFRVGLGYFGEWRVPKAAIYLLGGTRMSGPEGAPSVRLGLGFSLPVMARLAAVGIPTMLEFGVDPGVRNERTRGFARAGFNF